MFALKMSDSCGVATVCTFTGLLLFWPDPRSSQVVCLGALNVSGGKTIKVKAILLKNTAAASMYISATHVFEYEQQTLRSQIRSCVRAYQENPGGFLPL